ncbi:MAG: heme-copper oxidase subunit III [Flavobacteriaceae bacterium]|jgi:cytochrome c oxidase subunit III|nr:heme-copper oxidase subunit III [Flavobacteriaceae bacterium]MBT4113114.1 heme-copper oxidase subunit III [Flavobacteriaceae bacterium]MBT4613895.1 heme-copper oxidase subunit III [Flavobacteriaceae bacterium]MBT5246143.1 heme-copper oxidase subunit III [Flavobacteriaceae bacterium]MBT5650590.1 heme-copper oxidase subunit III [Flavobacteriaceae bacterium]
MGNTDRNINKKNKRAIKMMVWLGIASLFMTFAGFTSAFIVSKSREDWILNFDLPTAFSFSLFIIITSSLSLILARRELLKNNFRSTTIYLTITFVLGVIFIISQFIGFNEIIENGYHFTGPTSTITTSFIFLIAFVHLVHVAAGLLVLLFVIYRNIKRKYSTNNILGFELASIFWHFVDILWIYLFLFLVFFK